MIYDEYDYDWLSPDFIDSIIYDNKKIENLIYDINWLYDVKYGSNVYIESSDSDSIITNDTRATILTEESYLSE
jgi:hypothetical protein